MKQWEFQSLQDDTTVVISGETPRAAWNKQPEWWKVRHNFASAIEYVYVEPTEPEVVVVTRHKSLVQFLENKGIVPPNTPYIEHAEFKDVIGKHVIGVLPLHYAAVAAKVTVLNFATPPELRGVELTLEQLEKFYKGIKTFVVTEV